MASEPTDSQMDGGGIIRAVMSFSGGMDSTSLLLRLIKEGYKIDCISFNYGQKHNIEIERASLNISYLRKSESFWFHHLNTDSRQTKNCLNY